MKRTISCFLLIWCIMLCVSAMAEDEWKCPACGREENIRRFCGACGAERPANGSIPGNFKPEDVRPEPGKNIIEFGKYYWDSGEENSKKPIRWYVIDRIDDRYVLLLSQYGLDVREYHSEWTRRTWEQTELYSWLNQTFLDEAFSEEEKKCIHPKNLELNGLSQKNLNSKENGNNMVFLLSEKDVRDQYFKMDSNQICEPTEYAVSRGAYVETDSKGRDHCWWWLRTWLPAEEKTNARTSVLRFEGPNIVDCNGEIRYYGARNDHVVVRPACWIDLNAALSLSDFSD